MGYGMKKNQIVTAKSTSLILGKSKSLMGLTKKILEGKSKELSTHEGITIIGDLMWEEESRQMNWYEAMEYAKNLRLGGYDNWRLPTIEELKKIVTLCDGVNIIFRDDNWEEIRDKNIANETYQTNYKSKGFDSLGYWSSTTLVSNEDRARYIFFYRGDENGGHKKNYFPVRCVRAG